MVLFTCSNAGEVGGWGANKVLTLQTQAGSLPELLTFILSACVCAWVWYVCVHVCVCTCVWYVCKLCVHVCGVCTCVMCVQVVCVCVCTYVCRCVCICKDVRSVCEEVFFSHYYVHECFACMNVCLHHWHAWCSRRSEESIVGVCVCVCISEYHFQELVLLPTWLPVLWESNSGPERQTLSPAATFQQPLHSFYSWTVSTLSIHYIL